MDYLFSIYIYIHIPTFINRFDLFNCSNEAFICTMHLQNAMSNSTFLKNMDAMQ